MAVINGAYFGLVDVLGGFYESSLREAELVNWNGGGGSIDYYAMRARDVNAPSLTYRYWVSAVSPDLSGSSYTGAFSGGSINFTDFTVEKVFG